MFLSTSATINGPNSEFSGKLQRKRAVQIEPNLVRKGLPILPWVPLTFNMALENDKWDSHLSAKHNCCKLVNPRVWQAIGNSVGSRSARAFSLQTKCISERKSPGNFICELKSETNSDNQQERKQASAKNRR